MFNNIMVFLSLCNTYKLLWVFVQIDDQHLVLMHRSFAQKVSVQRLGVDDVFVLFDEQY